MRNRLQAFYAGALHHVGLLIALGLLVAAKDFAARHPALTAVLVFVFSLPYLAAAIATRRAHYLYGTMLFGAVAYFLTWYAVGVAGALFPLLSVPLVVGLWLVAWRLELKAPDLPRFPVVVLRAMNITVAVFATWALLQVYGLMAGSGFLRQVAGITLLAYAVLYLAHCVRGAPAVYIYVLTAFLTAGGMLWVGALTSIDYCWTPAVATAAVALFMAAKAHASDGFTRSRHFYLCSGAAIIISLVCSAVSWWSFPLAWAFTSLVVWVAYTWLARAIPDVRGATTSERALGSWLFLGSMGLAVPLALLVFISPGDTSVASAALVCGLIFASIARQRRDAATGVRNTFVLPAAMFIAAGLMGVGGLASDARWFTMTWPLVCLVASLGALWQFFRTAQSSADGPAQRSFAESAVFPAFFAWYVLLRMLGPEAGLAGAAVGLAGVLALAWRLGGGFVLCGIGPAVAGIYVSGLLLAAGYGTASWVACAAGAAVAGGWSALAEARGREVARGGTSLSWLILSVAAVVIAAVGGVGPTVEALTAIGFISILLAAFSRRGTRRDLLDSAVTIVGALATVGVLVLGPMSGLGLIRTGVCVLVLSVAYAVAWALRHASLRAWAAEVLFALGALLVICGLTSAVDMRLYAGAAVVLALFVLSAAAKKRQPAVAAGAAVVGHVTGIALACVALVQAWPGGGPNLLWPAIPFVVFYALMPRLRKDAGFRVGTACWISVAVLFALSAFRGTPYREQIPLVALLSVAWIAVGFVFQRAKAEGWPTPLYICAGLLTTFCGFVSLFAPAAGGSWQVFLINGIAMALLFMILHQEMFICLVTLALSLMAYDWVRATTTPFTQDLLFYLVIVSAAVASLFLVPHGKRLVERMGLLPTLSIFTWQGAALVAVPVLGLILVLVSAYSIKITMHPRFCTACHYMDGYYESWQHSSHKDVACVQCHYEPGIQAGVEGKIDGMVQLVKYIAHSYSGKPHAMIFNSSCTRAGCHVEYDYDDDDDDEMDHSKETLVFRGKIKFRHDKHLSEHPRGKVLNCVSCHGQAVEGRHISVTETTCVTCHFYGRGSSSVAVGKCETCHIAPEHDVTFAGHTFKHTAFLKGKEEVECAHCHSQVTQGDGAVSRSRCRSCHLRVPAEIEDQAKFHLVHTSEGHFDCQYCHDEIKHGASPMAQQLLTSSNCSTCHGEQRHTIQEKIYAGVAIPKLEKTPDVMYEVGVACDGCHTDLQVKKVGEIAVTTRTSGAKPCVNCHADDSYGEQLAMWQQETKDMIIKLKADVKKVEDLRRSTKAPEAQVIKADNQLDAARTKLSHVVMDGSYGAHNMMYVTTILEAAEEELNECVALLNGEERK